MQVIIQSRGFKLTNSVSELVKVKLLTALRRHLNHVRTVQVRLGDENGPRGGVDKFCTLHIQFRNGAVARTRAIRSDLYVAIDRASQRLSMAVSKRLARR